MVEHTSQRLSAGPICPPHVYFMPCRVPEECPQGALELVRRCLRRDPSERPTAAEAAQAIDALDAAPAPRMQASRCMLQLYQCLPCCNVCCSDMKPGPICLQIWTPV